MRRKKCKKDGVTPGRRINQPRRRGLNRDETCSAQQPRADFVRDGSTVASIMFFVQITRVIFRCNTDCAQVTLTAYAGKHLSDGTREACDVKARKKNFDCHQL
jgi:hypothetical protein